MPPVDWRALVRDVPDFPKPGILFRDVTPILGDGPAFTAVIDELAARASALNPVCVVGIEARGFIFGSALALRLGRGFVPIRKPGKLPWRTRKRSYDLEYGTDAIEMHDDAIIAGARVVLVDDLLATGGTAAAATHLLREAGADVAAALFVLELGALGGRAQLPDVAVAALHTYR